MKRLKFLYIILKYIKSVEPHFATKIHSDRIPENYARKPYYHPPTKLWEGNVIQVCLSVSLSTEGHHMTITHDALDLTVQALSVPLDIRPVHMGPPAVTTGGGH